MKITIGHLYPDLLNLYGDRGNIQCLMKRCLWRGIEAETIAFELGDKIDFSKLDIVLLGGGSDREQMLVCEKLKEIQKLYLLGLAEIAVYFVVFTVVIRALDLPTPGRTQEPEQAEKEIDPANVRRLIEALGGPDNIRTVDNCFTRLRVTVKDTSLLDTAALLSMPHKGLVQEGQRLQLVCGLQAAQTRRLLEEQLEQCAAV